MKHINKQKFLIELSRLLTFMFDDDKETVLSMYAELFDAAEDEEGLCRALISPTRQAVIIARRYDAEARGKGDEKPDFVLAIEEAGAEAAASLRKNKEPAAALAEKEEELSEEEEPARRNVSSEEDYPAEKKKEPVVWKLILYLIPAIVLGLAGVLLVLLIAVIVLALSAAVGAMTVWAVSAAINCGFDLFSDMLVVIGSSVILAAVGVLFLWTAVWLCCGAIPGIIRGLISLGEKCCYREVAYE